MKAVLLLADAARTHPDGTFSVLRGGIEKVGVPRNQPVVFRGSIVVRITAAMTEQGTHEFKIRLLNDDGESVAPDMDGQFEVPRGGGSVQLAADVNLILPGYGRYIFTVLVDRQEKDTWELQAGDVQQQPRA